MNWLEVLGIVGLILLVLLVSIGVLIKVERDSCTAWCVKVGYAGSVKWRGNRFCIGYETGVLVLTPYELAMEGIE